MVRCVIFRAPWRWKFTHSVIGRRRVSIASQRSPRLSRHVDEATLAALRSFIARRGQGGERVLVRALDALQGARYIELAEGRAANESFVYGWLAHRLGNATEATA